MKDTFIDYKVARFRDMLAVTQFGPRGRVERLLEVTGKELTLVQALCTEARVPERPQEPLADTLA